MPEAQSHGCGLPRDQKQTIYLQEALQKEGSQSHLGPESETDEKVDTSHVCFMANDNTPKVISEPPLDKCELTMDELGEAFEELSNNYDFLKKKYLKMKKENETLQNKIITLSKEKDDLSSTLLSTQKDFDAHKISCKAKLLAQRPSTLVLMMINSCSYVY